MNMQSGGWEDLEDDLLPRQRTKKISQQTKAVLPKRAIVAFILTFTLMTSPLFLILRNSLRFLLDIQILKKKRDVWCGGYLICNIYLFWSALFLHTWGIWSKFNFKAKKKKYNKANFKVNNQTKIYLFKSLKYLWFMASWAVMRFPGSYTNILQSKLKPRGSKTGQRVCTGLPSYFGKSSWYSGRSTIDGQIWGVGVPKSLNILMSWSDSFFPGKRGRPVAISAKMQPADHKSMEGPYFFDPIKTSGGRYHKVTTSWEYFLTGIPKALARPKSANFNSPFRLIKRFCGWKKWK